MMNIDPDAAADPWRCCYNNAGEAAATAVPTSGETGSFFADKAPDYSTDDLFELVWEQEGQDGGASGPAVSRLRSPRLSNPPDVRFEPPSEDEMAAWLISAIVKGDELVCNDDGGRQPMADDSWDVPMMGTTATATNKKQKVTPEGKMGTEEMRKAPAGGSSRSHHGEAHNLTEKRRRHKINERLKTLQQLVPGCSKSNQASTLDQTIHYMKSLQHQVQAMSVGLPPTVYPVVQPQCVPPATPVAMPFPAAPMFLGGHPPSTTMMVPFGTTMIPLPHYPAAAVMMPGAAVAPLYPAAAPTTTAVAPAGDAVSASHLHGFSSRSSSKGSGMGSNSLCQSDRT